MLLIPWIDFGSISESSCRTAERQVAADWLVVPVSNPKHTAYEKVKIQLISS